eukprot:XP_001697180.1 predicted protein [Chlamydomonas reinhardtii]
MHALTLAPSSSWKQLRPASARCCGAEHGSLPSAQSVGHCALSASHQGPRTVAGAGSAGARRGHTLVSSALRGPKHANGGPEPFGTGAGLLRGREPHLGQAARQQQGQGLGQGQQEQAGAATALDEATVQGIERSRMKIRFRKFWDLMHERDRPWHYGAVLHLCTALPPYSCERYAAVTAGTMQRILARRAKAERGVREQRELARSLRRRMAAASLHDQDYVDHVEKLLPLLEETEEVGHVAQRHMLPALQRLRAETSQLQGAMAARALARDQVLSALQALYERRREPGSAADPDSWPPLTADEAVEWRYPPVQHICGSRKSPVKEVMEVLLGALQPLLPGCGPTGLSQALWALARLGHPPPPAFLSTLNAAFTLALLRTEEWWAAEHAQHHVSNVLWAGVVLGLELPGQLVAAALGLMERRVEFHWRPAPSRPPQHLHLRTPSPAALALHTPKPHGPADERCCRTGLREAAEEASPQSLALTAWAAAQLPSPPPSSWWWRMEDAALAKRRSLAPQDVSHLVWSMARSGHRPPRSWLHGMCVDAHAALPGFRPQELTNLLWGLVVCGYKPSAGWTAAAVTAAQAKLSSYKAFELAVLLWSLACLEAGPLLPRTFAPELFFHSYPKLAFFSPQDCSNTLWALARLGLRPPESWMAVFVEESFTQLPRFTSQHMANTVWAFAKLGRKPPEPWMDRFFLESRPLLLPRFKASELAATLLAFGIARLQPPRQWLNQRWLDAATSAATRLAEQGGLAYWDLVTLERAYGTFGALLPPPRQVTVLVPQGLRAVAGSTAATRPVPALQLLLRAALCPQQHLQQQQ